MRTKKNLPFLVAIALVLAFCASTFAETKIVRNGKSDFTIVIPKNAPTSVRQASEELQRDLELATGAKLPLREDGESNDHPIISLGATEQAKANGYTSEEMAEESFRMVTKDGNLYILGPDTPDGGWTSYNGTSNGTANGVYTFLEDYLDVRWLMPGDLGRDIPKRSDFSIDDIDTSVTPKFMMRKLTHVNNYTTPSQYEGVTAWERHQKLGGSVDWNFNHNWWRTLNSSGGERGAEPDTETIRKLYAQHPEWFAMDKNGERPFPKNHYGKLETTNQELVKFFAEQAIKNLKASERPIAYSLSPSDGSSTWSQSPESKALYDPNPSGAAYDPESPTGGASMSSLVATWYHDIASIVAKEYPEGKLTGYIYSTYVYPPLKVSAKLPDNFTPMIAPSRNYGYGLYRSDVKEYYKDVTNQWSNIITGDWFYYDLPGNLLRNGSGYTGDKSLDFPGSTGVITPAAPEIPNTIFPQLVKTRISGGLVYGVPGWSNGALSNYIFAKMWWDPSLDANDLQKEWLHRAYGPQAGKAMEAFYAKLDDRFRTYFQENEKMRYEALPQLYKDLYAVHYPEMESLLLKAKDQEMTEIQRKRFQLIENNLIVLQWRLRNARFLPADFSSPLQRTDAEISDLVSEDHPDFPLFAGAINSSSNQRSKPRRLPWKVKVGEDKSAVEEDAKLKWNSSQFLIHAAKDGEIRIDTQMVMHNLYFTGYELKDGQGNLLESGLLNTDRPITFSAKAGESFLLNITLRKYSNFQLHVANAAIAKGSLKGKTLTLSGEEAPVYVFYVQGEAPVGLLSDKTGVNIRKPYNEDQIQNYVSGRFSEQNANARILQTFDDAWKFSPDPADDGAERGVTKLDFDDRSWSDISPHNWWQTQGFDYHGSAWYRVKFNLEALNQGEIARFVFGAVDGNAEVYLNGYKIGEHSLGEDLSGWDKTFTTVATRRLLVGENILAVKVTSKPVGPSGIFKPVVLVGGVPR